MKRTRIGAWRAVRTAGFALMLVGTPAATVAQTPAPAQTDKTVYSFSLAAIARRGEEAARRQEREGMRGVIQGRVLLDNGEPAVGVLVEANFKRHQTGAQGEGCAVTDSRGRYRIHGLNPYYWKSTPQDFYVQVYGVDQPFLPDPGRIVPLGKTRHHTAIHVDFTMHRAPVITVRVRDAVTGAPVVGMSVSSENGGINRVEGVTDAKGEYRFRARDLQTEIRLQAIQSKYLIIDSAPSSGFYHEIRFASLAELHGVTLEVRTTAEVQEPIVVFPAAPKILRR